MKVTDDIRQLAEKYQNFKSFIDNPRVYLVNSTKYSIITQEHKTDQNCDMLQFELIKDSRNYPGYNEFCLTHKRLDFNEMREIERLLEVDS